MKLSVFINKHLEEILKEWEGFAQTLLPAAAGMSALALRDHARQILKELALDIETDQTKKEQLAKSQGMAPPASGTESAASTHGTLRQVSGFTLLQLTAEFRALRASVLRLWLPHVRQVTQETSHDMVRFNETIDQALAESVVTYSDQADRARDTFLAILGHDLRSPLTTMAMGGAYLTRPGVGTDATTEVGARIKRSAASMTTMVNDLLEFARTQLGGQMPITSYAGDMAEICRSAVDDAMAAQPECNFELESSGDLTGVFDAVRLHQVFANLLNNAAQYRTPGSTVRIIACGEADALTIQVTNRGATIPSASLEA
ncbi:MAG: HAMP domain-containing histidine kinase, partial [Herminiimonas sp.]|nr:HAMP domain-containing histidine kinase [Herminiimonas sp.]